MMIFITMMLSMALSFKGYGSDVYGIKNKIAFGIALMMMMMIMVTMMMIIVMMLKFIRRVIMLMASRIRLIEAWQLVN